MHMRSRIVASYTLVIIIYVIIIPFLISTLGSFLDSLLGLNEFLGFPYHALIGMTILVYGCFWIVWSQLFLVNLGKGHPNEIMGRELSPLTKQLVTEGPYHYTRNPMAYGLLVTYFAGIPLLQGTTVPLLLCPFACVFEVWYHRRFEEPGLRQRFGESFDEYSRQVPLLFPRIPLIGQSRGKHC